jgi:hypothetical protein
MYPEDVAPTRDAFEKAHNNPGISIQKQLRTRHKNGNYIWIELSIMNLLDNKSVGANVVIYGILPNGEDQKKRSNSLKLIIASYLI